MIYLAINHIAFELNQFLRRSSIAGEDIVVLANPVGSDGRTDQLTADKVVLFLAGVERDTMPGRTGNSHMLAHSAPTFLNLYLMVAANFTGKNYPESLKYLSRVIAFFQQHPVFDRSSSPAMDEGIDKLILDMENLDRRELNNIWGMFGGKYIPSVLYRVRMVGIDSNSITGRRHIISEPTVAVHFAKGK
ncbi:DUF4255 domain-containing protein [Massilia psychrophila]|jgi:hypothetical protein|uniref:Pvc16 N-terminal domain-containing protein n=1 Tax=Massilia psychrophila TaxID=1603353 RepID=A0A2G8T4A6_9BURK|nr:DUF4255 domain-containing protein [Massilia psychrophila]PIL40887.1 hypothetical protein CR103_05420 [Massilia psychrophila]GGE72487.1 hypothetical protein GCM10008020_16460 [Massilia psychrophila]